jgi:hypothetical protein
MLLHPLLHNRYVNDDDLNYENKTFKMIMDSFQTTEICQQNQMCVFWYTIRFKAFTATKFNKILPGFQPHQLVKNG